MAPHLKHLSDVPPLSQSPTASSSESQIALEPTTFKPSFQFVVNEDSKQARQTVRKHVMREYRRRERWEHSGAVAAPPRVAKKDAAAKPKATRRKKGQPNSSPESSPSKESSPVARGAPSFDIVLNGSSVGDRAYDGSNSGSDNDIEEFRQLDTDSGVFGGGAVVPSSQDISRVYYADPWAAVGHSQVDPFSNSNFDNGPDLQSILYHCKLASLPSGLSIWTIQLNFGRCVGHATAHG